MIAMGLGTCTSDDLQHDPYNVFTGLITSGTVNVLWNGTWSSSTGVNVYYNTQIAPSASWTLANAAPIATTISNYTITNLAASTAYKVKVVDVGNTGCKPIEILFSTLAI